MIIQSTNMSKQNLLFIITNQLLLEKNLMLPAVSDYVIFILD